GTIRTGEVWTHGNHKNSNVLAIRNQGTTREPPSGTSSRTIGMVPATAWHRTQTTTTDVPRAVGQAPDPAECTQSANASAQRRLCPVAAATCVALVAAKRNAQLGPRQAGVRTATDTALHPNRDHSEIRAAKCGRWMFEPTPTKCEGRARGFLLPRVSRG